jgi:hypothetical protein
VLLSLVIRLNITPLLAWLLDSRLAAPFNADFACATVNPGYEQNLLATIVGRQPKPRGLPFDLPYVVHGVPAPIEARGPGDRIRIKAGNFLESVLTAAGAYLPSHIIHDWSEDQWLTIFDDCCRDESLNPNSRLLIVERELALGDASPGQDARHNHAYFVCGSAEADRTGLS